MQKSRAPYGAIFDEVTVTVTVSIIVLFAKPASPLTVRLKVYVFTARRAAVIDQRHVRVSDRERGGCRLPFTIPSRYSPGIPPETPNAPTGVPLAISFGIVNAKGAPLNDKGSRSVIVALQAWI